MLTLQKLSLMSAAAALMAAAPAPAHANTNTNTNTSDEAFEFWLNPSLSTDLDDDTSIELETAQRFRSAEDGRVDTYFARFWGRSKCPIKPRWQELWNAGSMMAETMNCGRYSSSAPATELSARG